MNLKGIVLFVKMMLSFTQMMTGFVIIYSAILAYQFQENGH